MAEQQRRYVVITTTENETVSLSDYVKNGYSEIILSWGPISHCKIEPIELTSEPGSCSFVVSNNQTINSLSRFSSITGLIYADVKIYQEGILIFWGTIEDLTNIGNADVTVQCITKDAELSRKFEHTIIDKDSFPYADLNDIGKIVPIVYGEAKRVPLAGIVVGLTGKLLYAIDGVSESTLYLSDGYDLWPSSGYLEIDNERMEYTRSTSEFTVVRAQGNTPIEPHAQGAMVYEVKAEHLYCCEGSEIGDVYIGDLKVDEYSLTGITVTKYAKGDLLDHPNFCGVGISYPLPQQGLNGLLGAASRMGGMAANADNLSLLDLPNAEESNNRPEGIGTVLANRDLTACYDSEINGYALLGSGPYYRAAAMKFPVNTGGPTLSGVHFHICMDGSFCSNPPTAVYFGRINIWTGSYPNKTATGCDLVDIPMDPSAGECPQQWFDIDYYGSYSIIPLTIQSAYMDPDIVAATEDETLEWYLIAWPDATDSHLRIYEVHKDKSFATEESTCPSPCPYCPDNENSSAILGPGAATGGGPVNLGAVQKDLEPFSWNRIYADVTGIGYGSPIAELDSPEDFCEDIISTRCGVSMTMTHDTTGCTENVVVMQKPDVRALLSRIAKFSKSISYFTPSAHTLKQMTGTYSTTATIGASDMFENQAWCNYTNKSYIFNKLTAQYNYYWWGKDTGVYTIKSIDSDSPSSQSVYGLLETDDNLTYIADETQAQAVLDWRLEWLKRPRLMVEFIGTLTNNINRKVGDIIQFDTTDSYIDDMLAGLVESTDQFLILEIVFQPDGAIRISTIRI